MSKNQKTSVEIPVTFADIQAELEAMVVEMRSSRKVVVDQIIAGLVAHFEAAGGCRECRGRGWVVTWDTMDSMTGCYAEYGSCSKVECTDETRAKSGLHPSYSKYDRIRGVKDPLTNHQAYSVIVGPLDEQIHSVEADIRSAAESRRNFVKGDDVVVVRGRKVPVGTRGRVAWVSSNTGGILVKPEAVWQDRVADGTWVNPANLEKVYKQ